jgi:uncharacterized protein YbaA (DUF1428 family)
MSYVDGFVLPVPKDNIEAYRTIAQRAGELWKEHGALQYLECVADDMEDKGYCTTFPQAIAPKDGETIIFAFITFRSREHRDEVNAKVMADPRIHECGDPENLPFECKRMIYGGFKTIVEH